MSASTAPAMPQQATRTPWREPLLMASSTVGPGVTMATAEARMNSSRVAVDMKGPVASGQCDAAGAVRPAD